MFEIKSRDAGGRICRWTVGKHEITTPQIAIVVNPNMQIIPPKELERKFGAELIITNAYICKNSRNADEIEKQGLHKYYSWKGPIYTDSGTYQMFSKGGVSITQSETLEYQKKIGSDIITPLDLFTVPEDSRSVAKHKLTETVKRIKEAREIVSDGTLVGPVQGGVYKDLRRRAAREVSKTGADVYAIGGIVPLMMNYRYRELVDVVLSAKIGLSANRPVHAFGCGHPMVFSLLVACGIDLFDSAAYALYAKDKRYMTERGTEHVGELRELPCECPVCSKYTARELDEKRIAEHNLYQTFKEIKAIRHAINEGTLWELVEQRVRAHPALVAAYRQMRKYNKYLETVTPATSPKAFFELGTESRHRPEIYRLKKRVKQIENRETVRWMGIEVPRGLKNTYPVGQSVLLDDSRHYERKVDSREIARDVLELEYGPGAGKAIDGAEIEHSKSTNRVRHVVKNGVVLGTFRARDGMFVPTDDGANEIIKHIEKGAYRVTVSDETVPFVMEGKSVFSKFVVSADERIRPLDEVFVADKTGRLLATGTAILNGSEMKQFDEGVAVKTRHVKKDQPRN